MDESCDEGGPCPPHKIPQDTETKMKCLEQNFIHLPIYHITRNIQPRPSTTIPVLQLVHPPPNVDVSFIEETSITKDFHYTF